MKVVINIMQSLVNLNKWTLIKFQLKQPMLGVYVGYLTVKECENCIKIFYDGAIYFVTENDKEE